MCQQKINTFLCVILIVGVQAGSLNKKYIDELLEKDNGIVESEEKFLNHQNAPALPPPPPVHSSYNEFIPASTGGLSSVLGNIGTKNLKLAGKRVAKEKVAADALDGHHFEKRMHAPAPPPPPASEKFNEKVPMAEAPGLSVVLEKNPNALPTQAGAGIQHNNGNVNSNANTNANSKAWGSSNGNGNGNDNSKRDVSKRSIYWPALYGYDLRAIGSHEHPTNQLRPGMASEGWSCDWVRPIPDWLRNEMYSDQGNISSYYQKYTEAYGIPIMGSDAVTDIGLMRACYTIAVMLASSGDIRNSIYLWFVRVSLIPDGVNQDDLVENNPCPSNIDCGPNGVRGLGPTTSVPVVSAGDDNMRCPGFDRYFDQNILVHEFAHAIDLFGVCKSRPGFHMALEMLFKKNVIDGGMWNNTYAATNMRECFAVAVQFYFNAWRYPSASYTTLGVYDQQTLRQYDPELTALLDEIFPCQKELNIFLDSCHYKWACNTTRLQPVELYAKEDGKKSNCAVIFSSNSIYSKITCGIKACEYGDNVFQHKNGKCRVLRCASTSVADLQLTSLSNGWSINFIPDMLDMSEEMEQLRLLEKSCTAGYNAPSSEMCNVTGVRSSCGYSDCEGDTRDLCEYNCNRLGCCWQNDSCYYPLQVCEDSDELYCRYAASAGECTTNPAFMYQACPFTCGICEDLMNMGVSVIQDFYDYLDTWTCINAFFYCDYWAIIGECVNNAAFMNAFCGIRCGNCTVTEDPLLTFVT